MKKKILIICGGSGGHFFPGISIAQSFLSKKHIVHLAISQKQIDEKIAEFLPNSMECFFLPLGKGKILGMLSAFWKSFFFIKEKKFDCAIGMGGRFSFPVLLSAFFLRIPIYLHDSNTLPGDMNTFFSRFFLCQKVFLGFKESAPFFSCPSEIVGTPVRFSSLKKKGNMEDLEQLKDNVCVLTLGGSQGAKNLNTYMLDLARLLPKIQFVHISGHSDYERMSSLAPENSLIFPFYHSMENLYLISDLVISRSGAGTLAELSFFSKPSILIPYPFSKKDHQKKNAEVFSVSGASLFYEERFLSLPNLQSVISSLLSDDEKLKEMGISANSFYRGNSADKISNSILKEIIQ